METYGCTMNQGEGRRLEELLASQGHEVIENADDADLVVLNTCTVIKETEGRMVRRMAELNAQRKELVVTGCMATVQADDVIKVAPRAMIMGPRDYPGFTARMEERFGRGDQALPLSLPTSVTSVVPISQGCTGNCSYCITKLARGQLTSYPPEDIVQEARRALERGAKELLVTAQDTACYGFDRRAGLPELLSSITALPGEFMVRVGMMNPNNLSRIIDRFLPVLRSPRIYAFLHLPVQSGSPSILNAMNRGYLPSDFISLVEKVRSSSPGITLATDVITGFPGESAEDHRMTLEMVERVRPDVVNVTRFSPRPGTPAARARNQVPGWVSKERSREMTALRFRISSEINARMVGRVERIMVTEEGKGNTSIGRTRSYKPVVVPGRPRIGSVFDVEIVDSAPTHLIGRP